MSRFPSLGLLLAVLATPAFSGPPTIGRVALPAEIAAWNTDVRPDGKGLPEGGGSVSSGEEVYLEQCAACHGDFGEGIGRWPALAGGFDTLRDDRPVKTVGSYWPYLSTVWDYVYRTMPYGDARSLSADEVYALTAYILYLNDLVGEDFVLNRQNFGDVRLPNEAGFIDDDRDKTEAPQFSVQPCMSGCKKAVTITKRAAILNVTPD